MSVKRWDRSELEKAERTPQGFLKVPVYATRTGVFKYTKPDGSIRRELRLPEEVFKKESMATLAHNPLTYQHPQNMVNASNANLFMKGFTTDQVEKVDDKYLKTYVVITDNDFIQDVENKKIKEVSCGYNCNLEETSGTWNGEVYDCIQRDIVYNHLAGVYKGRAGAEVRFRLDSEDALQQGLNEGEKMVTVNIGGKSFECSPELKSAIESMIADQEKEAQAGSAQFDSLKSEKEKLMNEKDQLQAKADSLEAEKNKKFDAEDVEKKVSERVASRLRVIGAAKEILPSDTKLDEMSDRQIKEAIIKKDSAAADLEKKSDTYIDARFDSIFENIEEKKAKLAGDKTKTEKTDADDSSEAARKRQIERTTGAWKETT